MIENIKIVEELKDENAILRAELATARQFICSVAKDPNWTGRANGILIILMDPKPK